MKKILLIGELGEIERSINDCLTEHYQVQLCAMQVSQVKAMMKIAKPQLIIISQTGSSNIDKEIFQEIRRISSVVPVIGITSEEQWKKYSQLYHDEHFQVLFRPILKNKLLKICEEMLKEERNMQNQEQEEAVSAKKKKIMLVDDSALALRNLKSMLQPKYDVCLAKSGEQALEMIPRKEPDLILLDYEMEGMDGKDTFAAIKSDERMEHIPVVFLTSISDKQAIYSVLKMKPEGYILKPPDSQRIFETIEEILNEEL